MKVLWLILALSAVAQASVDSVPDGPLQNIFRSSPATSSLTASEIYLRTQKVYEHFSVLPEVSENAFVQDLNRAQTTNAAAEILKILDPKNQWSRFNHLYRDLTQSFSDRDAKQVSAFSVQTAVSGQNLSSVAGLKTHLIQIASQNVSSKPLQGLRVALDPGHMGYDISSGTENWDVLTGKFISDAAGNQLSEGVLNLQTSLLLERQLQDLGAETLVTHRDLAPVSQTPYVSLNLTEYGREQLHSLSLSSWFQSLLEGADGSALLQRFDQNSMVRDLFSENMRSTDFILEADLDARARAIADFHPDITLIIHYDVDVTTAQPHGVNPLGRDGVKTYMPGAFGEGEFAELHDRALFAKHLYDAESWNASYGLSKEIANEIHKSLAIPKEAASAGGTVEIEPGVLARNLALTRKIYSHAITYVECAYYNNPKEFSLMRNATHPMTLSGKNHPYSDRVLQVATAMKTAILNFVQSFRAVE